MVDGSTNEIMRVAIYARVSTDRGEQNPDVQIDALKAWISGRGDMTTAVYVDHISGAKRERPQLDAMLHEIEENTTIDAVAVVKLDRLARSTRDLLDLSAYLQAQEVDLLVKDQALDTSTPAGRLMFTVLGAIAEFERDLIIERTKAGLEHAKRNGKILGRPRVETQRPHAIRAAMDAVLVERMTVKGAAMMHKVSRSTLRRRLAVHDALEGK